MAQQQTRSLDIVPESETFLLETPPYNTFRFSPYEIKYVLGLRDVQAISAYCCECGKESIFIGNKPSKYASSEAVDQLGSLLDVNWVNLSVTTFQNYLVVSLRCKNNKCRQRVLFFFFISYDKSNDEGRITKIGQYPSLIDLQRNQIKKYQGILERILGKESSKEYKRAVGLAAHGVGIGSFVYLRRIFEGLVEDAHRKASSQPAWSEDEYNQSRMDEKILLLKDFLPNFLVEQRALYSIMSKGIHELSEEECLRYFDIVKVGIESILDEKLQEEEKRKKQSEVRNAIARVKGELS